MYANSAEKKELKILPEMQLESYNTLKNNIFFTPSAIIVDGVFFMHYYI